MKTTVEVSDSLRRAARAHCASHGITFRALIEAGLRQQIKKPEPKEPFRLGTFGFRGEGQQVRDWREIRGLLYEGHGSDLGTAE